MPRSVPWWVRFLIAVEVAGVIALGVVTVRVAGEGVHAAGGIISWAAPQVGLTGSPPAMVQPPLIPSPAASAGVPGAIPSAGGLGGALNRSTADVVFGQIQLVTEIQEALRRYLELQTSRGFAPPSTPAAH